MSDISTTSYGRDNRCESSCDKGSSSIFMILILLMLCGGDNGLFGCGCGCDNGSGSCGSGGGLGGILPIILILCLCGGGSFF